MPSAVNNMASAISAYNNVARSGTGNSGPGIDSRDQGVNGASDDFAGLVKGAIREAVKISQESERASIAAVNDRADLSSVVTAVAEAEVALQTVVAVRDKVIDAYKEIVRMPM
jgi:flagellar hook-basal body complex protein FliE